MSANYCRIASTVVKVHAVCNLSFVCSRDVMAERSGGDSLLVSTCGQDCREDRKESTELQRHRSFENILQPSPIVLEDDSAPKIQAPAKVRSEVLC